MGWCSGSRHLLPRSATRSSSWGDFGDGLAYIILMAQTSSSLDSSTVVSRREHRELLRAEDADTERPPRTPSVFNAFALSPHRRARLGRTTARCWRLATMAC